MGGNLQWGTKSIADGSYVGSTVDTVYTDSPTNVESSASVWLKYKDNVDGSQEYAMGRVKKYPDGRLRFQQNADDALVGSCPRVQWLTSPLPSKTGRVLIYTSVQFGDAATPWPAYLTNKDDVLFLQVKGTGASQPVLSMTASYDSPTSETLKVGFNIKTVNTGQIVTFVSIPGLAKNTRHDFAVEGYLDWAGTGYWKVWHNGVVVAQYSGNTLMNDVADNVQVVYGIYRYQHVAKAPDDCAVIYHLAGIKNVL
jgi:hypothetical protein